MKNIFTSLSRLALLLGACAVTLPVSPAHSQGKGNGKAKGKQRVDTQGKREREAGELPYGLAQYREKKAEPPSGMQKKQDKDRQLTRRPDDARKNLMPPTHRKTESKYP